MGNNSKVVKSEVKVNTNTLSPITKRDVSQYESKKNSNTNSQKK